MNRPAMQGLNLNTPRYVKKAKLMARVADIAALSHFALRIASNMGRADSQGSSGIPG